MYQLLSIIAAFAGSYWLTVHLIRKLPLTVSRRLQALQLVIAAMFFMSSWLTLSWISLWLLTDPPSTYLINKNYYLTQSPGYGVAGTANYYRLTFYQNRTWWLDRKLGDIELACSCMGDEHITATINNLTATEESKHLFVSMENSTVVDSTLNFKNIFHFRVTIHDYP